MTTLPAGFSIEFFNSVGGAAFMLRLIEEWRSRGARVDAHHALGEAEYRAGSRLARRWRMYPGFAWSAYSRCRSAAASPSARIVTTNPFFAPLLVARASRGRCATVNLVYDLFPDALVLAGATRRGSWVARRCEGVTRRALRECDATVFLGERLRAHAEATYGPARLSAVIPVGADGAPFRSRPPAALPEGSRVRILYCGLMGSMHEHSTLRALWARRGGSDVSWAFHAAGSGYAQLRRAPPAGAGVEWGSPLADDAWREAMLRSQVALVTMVPGAERVAMPSKTYSALVAGQAVLAVCPQHSDLADLVRRHGCGWVVEPGDVDGLRAAVEEISAGGPGLLARRSRAFEAGHRLYDMSAVADLWVELLAGLSPVPGTRMEAVAP